MDPVAALVLAAVCVCICCDTLHIVGTTIVEGIHVDAAIAAAHASARRSSTEAAPLLVVVQEEPQIAQPSRSEAGREKGRR